MLVQKQMLLLDPVALPEFLYSCAMTEVLRKDSYIITERRMMFFTSQRVGDHMTPLQRKAAALARAAQLMDDVKSLQGNPAGQAAFLVGLDTQRNRERGEIRGMFSEVELTNAINDQRLYYAAIAANDVQSVATIAVCVIAVGGPMLAGAGISAIGSVGVGSGWAYFAVPIGFKSILAYSTADADTTLFGFVVGGVKNGILTLGELSAAAFNFGTEKAIAGATGLMNLAIGQWGQSCQALADSNGLLIAERNTALNAMMREPRGTALYKTMCEDLKELEARIGAGSAGRTTIASAMNKGAATNVWMKNFGGRFVPIACLTADVFGEVWRNQDTRATIEKSGPRYQ